MSGIFSLEKDIIEAGDIIILYISPEDVTSVKVEADGVVQNRLGRFRHSDMIGKSFGSKVMSGCGKKYMQLLRPTPELWTRVLPHRTQILYMPDISFIIEMLEIKEGSVVVESGTGSASFSHSLARAIGQKGHLHTFDFHESRAIQAKKEFEDHGLGNIVTANCRDVCGTGFGLSNIADAVFLDLPSPWLAIVHAKEALRKDRLTRIACFSPCMEQVQKTVPQLQEHGFYEIEMYEIILRPVEVEEISLYSPMAVEKLGGKRQLTDTMFVGQHRSEIKGHTSYLYFASLVPEHQLS